MARVPGVCPVCRQDIQVNDEREMGHCGKCGAQINCEQAMSIYQELRGRNEPQSTVQSQGDNIRQQRRAERAKEAEQRGRKAEAVEIIENMFKLCNNEQEYLNLRARVMEMTASDAEKVAMLTKLDEMTKERMKETLKKAKEYKDSKEPMTGTVIGYIIIIIIASLFGGIPGIIAFVLCLFSFVNEWKNRHNEALIKENEQAEALVSAYRNAGYKI